MTEDEVLHEFRASEALLEGHFKLSSGRHSAHYLPRELRGEIDKVVSPAMGGVIIGHEMGRALGKEALFVERPTGTFEFRRGFRLDPGDKVLLVEDVVTTGLSSREAIAAIKAEGGKVIAAASLVDRSAGEADLGVPFFTLVTLSFPTYAEDELPEELAAVPVEKPGSRKG
jgi:orotate phosphoribosyltransferase